MTILFLDIDGVLNSERWLKDGHMRRHGSDYWANHFDPAACALLEALIQQTGCKLVLSSSWRISHTTDEIAGYLVERGCPSARFVGATPSWRTCEGSGRVLGVHDRRGQEIQEWLDTNPGHERFAIVDDSDDMGSVLLPRLVRTTWQLGLEAHHVEALADLLGRR